MSDRSSLYDLWFSQTLGHKNYIYIIYTKIIYIYNFCYSDLLNESFHVCAEHATIIRSVTKIQTKNIKYISARQVKKIVMGDVKHEMVNDVLTRSCNDGDMRIWT